MHVAKVFEAGAEMQSPLLAFTKLKFLAHDAAFLTGGAAIGAEAVEEEAFAFILEAGAFREEIQGAADGVAAIKHTPLPWHELDAVDGVRVDGVEVLVRAFAEDAVVEADAVDQREVSEAGEATDEG